MVWVGCAVIAIVLLWVSDVLPEAKENGCRGDGRAALGHDADHLTGRADTGLDDDVVGCGVQGPSAGVPASDG